MSRTAQPTAIAVPLAFAMVFASLAACGKKEAATADAGTPVVTINGQAVSSTFFYDYLIRKKSVLVNSQQGPQAAQTIGSLGLQGLRDMIDRVLILQVAKDEGVMPSDADVQKEIDDLNTTEPGYTDKVVQKEHIPMDEFVKEVQFNLARERIITKGVTVPMTEVDQYIKENPTQFSVPAHASFLVIALKTPEKEAKIDAALAAGTPFKTVASQFSDSSDAKKTGGLVSDAPMSNFPKPLKDAIDKLTPLHASDWLSLPGATLKVYLLSKTADKRLDMTPLKKKALQRQLMLQRGQVTNDLESKIQAKLRTSTIDVSIPELKEPWEALAAQLKAAPTQGSAAQGAPSQGAPSQGAPSQGAPSKGAPTPAPSAPSGRTSGGPGSGAKSPRF